MRSLRNFSSIGTVLARNTSGTNNYALDDASPLSGVNYYRLKIVDRDGSYKYSFIIAVNNKQLQTLTLFPNPVNDHPYITHAKAAAGAVISIYAMDGRTISSTLVSKGAVQTTIDLSTLAAGVYQLVYRNGSSVESMKFVKQ